MKRLETVHCGRMFAASCFGEQKRTPMGAFFFIDRMESELDILREDAILWIWKASFPLEGGDRLKNRLEELRKARGIRQEELADALGVSRQTIGSLENGRYNPSILLAFKLARYFNRQIEDIFIYEEESI